MFGTQTVADSAVVANNSLKPIRLRRALSRDEAGAVHPQRGHQMSRLIDHRRLLAFAFSGLVAIVSGQASAGSGAPELVQNTDIQSQLTRMAESADFDWIAMALDRLVEVERGMRRNLLRSLSLDAFASALEKA